MLVRRCGKLAASVERDDIGVIQRSRDFRRICASRLFDRPLQDESTSVATGGLVARWRVVLRGVGLGKIRSTRAVLRFEPSLLLPLRRNDHAEARIAQLDPL